MSIFNKSITFLLATLSIMSFNAIQIVWSWSYVVHMSECHMY